MKGLYQIQLENWGGLKETTKMLVHECNKMEEQELLVKDAKPDIIGITETSPEYRYEGYVLFGRERNKGKVVDFTNVYMLMTSSRGQIIHLL